jgi:CDP-4-dehydro-6-deoxyglucose reductase
MDALLAAGDALVLQGPFGAVSVDARETRPLLMIAGGTGAAQALSIIEDLTLRRTERPVTLLCCADGEPDFYFRRSLETIRERWLETVFIADPRRTPDNAAMLWLARHADAFRDHRILLCGSPAFVYAAADVLTDAGIDGEKLESDVFAYAPRP